MSEFAYIRFMSNNMLTVEEQQHKDEIIKLTEQVFDASSIECDSKISKISQKQLREVPHVQGKAKELEDLLDFEKSDEEKG